MKKYLFYMFTFGFVTLLFSTVQVSGRGESTSQTLENEAVATSDTASTTTLITPFKRPDTKKTLPMVVIFLNVTLFVVISGIVLMLVFRKS